MSVLLQNVISTPYMLLFVHYCRSRECRKIMCDSQFNSELPSVTPPLCNPVNNILFLKTQKIGSSTVTNILNRYGLFVLSSQ